MDIEKLKKSLEGRGFTFRYFETGAEAADYLTEQLAGKTVGIGGSKTVEAIGLYEKLPGQGRGRGLALEDRAERGAR